MLPPADLADGDLLLAWLQRRGYSAIAVAAAISLALTLVRLAWAARSGLLFQTRAPVGFFNDPAMYLYLAMGAVLLGYWVWLPRGIAEMYGSLVANEIALDKAHRDRSIYDDFARRMRDARAWRLVPPAALALAFAGVWFGSLPGYRERMTQQDAWSMADPVAVGLSALWAFVLLYTLASVIGRYALATVWLRRLFREIELRVQPLHPDGAGGLGPLGALSIRVSYLVTIVGLLLAVTALTRAFYATRLGITYQPTQDIVFAIAIWAVGSPVVFFALPAVAHHTMRAAKDALLLDVGRSFEREYLALRTALANETQSLKEGVDRLQQLQNLYDTTRRFPVWPFNVENVRRFLGSFASPIAVAVATRLLLGLLGGE